MADDFATLAPGMFAGLFGNGNPADNYIYTSNQYWNIPFVNTAIPSPFNPYYELSNIVGHDISSIGNQFGSWENNFSKGVGDIGKGISDLFGAGNSLTTGLGVLSGSLGLVILGGGAYLLAKNQRWIK